VTVADRSVGTFLDDVASGGATPGGGATAAVAGAAGAALVEMVCANTLRGDPDAASTEALAASRDTLNDHRKRLLTLADEDMAAVDALMEAYAQSAGERRDDALEAAAVEATEVPLEIAETCRDVLEQATTVLERGAPNAAADGGIGVHLAHGALEAMVYTVGVNLASIDDAALANELAARADAAARDGDVARDRALESLAD